MVCNVITKIQTVKEAGAIFASAVTTDAVELSNYKYVDFIITTGAGTAADITVTLEGKLGASGVAAALPFKRRDEAGTGFTNISATGDTLSIGGTPGETGKAIYRITADDLSSRGYDRVQLITTAVTDSTVPGSIIAVLYEPRYTE